MKFVIRGLVCAVFVLFISSVVGLPSISNAGSLPEKVSEGIFRGPHPEESYFITLSKIGIKTVLSLESDPEIVMKEKIACQSFNIDFINIPLSEVMPPSTENLKRAVNVILQNRNGGIYVHCRRGIDRTGYVIAAFRILVEKSTLEAAYKECRDHGHSALVYFFWKNSLKEISRSSTKDLLTTAAPISYF